MAANWSLSRVMLCYLIVALSASGLPGIGLRRNRSYFRLATR